MYAQQWEKRIRRHKDGQDATLELASTQTQMIAVAGVLDSVKQQVVSRAHRLKYTSPRSGAVQPFLSVVIFSRLSVGALLIRNMSNIGIT